MHTITQKRSVAQQRATMKQIKINNGTHSPVAQNDSFPGAEKAMTTTTQKEPKVDQAPAHAISSNEETSPVRRRLLIVEDNEVACRQLQKFLQLDPQLEVDASNDGSKA